MTTEEIADATNEQPTPDTEQLVEADEAQAETSDEEVDLLDVTEIADKVVKLQVDGEEVVIPVKEALAGYQRQADYTRKTQEISEQRKQLQFAATLQEALQKDPENTLRLLNQQFGKNQPTAVTPEEEEYLTPEEQQVRQLNQRLAALEQERAMDALVKTIDTLQEKYGDEFNADEVVFRANQLGTTDLEAVFKSIAFDKVYAEKTKASKKLAEEQERLNAKRNASVVSSGASAKTSAPKSAPPKSIHEAFEMTKRQLGG
jgi:hypothetical protein